MKLMKFILTAGATAVIGFCLFSSRLLAETLTYHEAEGDWRTTHTLVITPAAPGYNVELQSLRAGVLIRQTFRTAGDLSTLVWTFSDPERQMELNARLQGADIVLSGSWRGNRVVKKFTAAGAPWNQLFQMGLRPFVLAGRKNYQFRSIGTQGPGEMKMGKFTVTRSGEEKIWLAGKEITSVHLRISLSGLLSVFWHGDYWYRKSDGRFLRYRGKNRSGGPIAVSELVRDSDDAAH
ncbi:MAG: hypothetical protein JXI33_07185 [Candidatus Aminicenantes bacterium]|nr:hypothetical protein [Candidatus Aminicenantes bacterium]